MTTSAAPGLDDEMTEAAQEQAANPCAAAVEGREEK